MTDHWSRPALWIAALAVMLGLTQTGSLLHEVIDWDESTFILMGADMARGNLPYVNLYDIKPPVTFAFFAGVELIAGRSLTAVRLFGDLCLLISVLAAFALARRQTPVPAAGAGAAMVLALMASPYGQYTSSELPATAAVMVGLWLMVRHPGALWAAALVGALVSVATLTRPNLAILAVAWGLFYLLAGTVGARRGGPVPATAVIAYGAAGLVPLGIVIAIYASAGELALLRLAVVDVSLAYAEGQYSWLGTGKRHLLHLIGFLRDAPWIYAPVLLAMGTGTAVAARRLWRSGVGLFDSALAVTFAAILVSILRSGGDYPHYWIQILPLGGCYAALGLAAAADRLGRGRARWAVVAVVLLPVAGAVAATGRDTLTVLTRPDLVRAHHAVRAAADTIAADLDPGETVWAQYNQIIHWYLDVPLLSRIATHPSNVVRRPILETLSAAGYVDPDEAGRLMALEPDFIVDDSDWRVRVPYLEVWGYDIDSYLATRYRLLATHGSVLVYRHRRHDTD